MARGPDRLLCDAADAQHSVFDLCFRRLDPIDENFQEIASQVFKPMFAHSREIKL
jgi:hypothetical protein